MGSFPLSISTYDAGRAYEIWQGFPCTKITQLLDFLTEGNDSSVTSRSVTGNEDNIF